MKAPTDIIPGDSPTLRIEEEKEDDTITGFKFNWHPDEKSPHLKAFAKACPRYFVKIILQSIIDKFFL